MSVTFNTTTEYVIGEVLPITIEGIVLPMKVRAVAYHESPKNYHYEVHATLAVN